ncbi:hypothetical protein BJ684DRAFT_20753 [Piptocephalis cylindrospora]|uniref:Uncharacterized protein n=1 Tax=Piptocephalis cylindrospora TaxID=1907219 RepID=A0A4P9Y225_9FUNG|nr:hypothetical protein BJ684DRAFT_20753 [Piptocephalis cylindrospora]|eukprot:RKP12724.1 hypothetical protein BJ684DRAFT_20753 [Piptocephalis cylindrospora]
MTCEKNGFRPWMLGFPGMLLYKSGWCPIRSAKNLIKRNKDTEKDTNSILSQDTLMDSVTDGEKEMESGTSCQQHEALLDSLDQLMGGEEAKEREEGGNRFMSEVLSYMNTKESILCPHLEANGRDKGKELSEEMILSHQTLRKVISSIPKENWLQDQMDTLTEAGQEFLSQDSVQWKSIFEYFAQVMDPAKVELVEQELLSSLNP